MTEIECVRFSKRELFTNTRSICNLNYVTYKTKNKNLLFSNIESFQLICNKFHK